MKLKAGEDRIVQIVVNPFHFADFSGVQHGGAARVKGFYLLHVFCIQREIPDFQILFHPFPVNGFWNYDHALLHVPAQDDLSRRFPVFSGNLDRKSVV